MQLVPVPQKKINACLSLDERERDAAAVYSAAPNERERDWLDVLRLRGEPSDQTRPGSTRGLSARQPERSKNINGGPNKSAECGVRMREAERLRSCPTRSGEIRGLDPRALTQ